MSATPSSYPYGRLVKNLPVIIIFLLASFALCEPLLRELHHSCRGDWDFFFAIYEVPTVSLFEYGQFPLWNPYNVGGLSLIGNPQAGFLSPIFAFTALFGTVAGLKIAVWAHLFLGSWGMWLLGEQLGIKGVARFAPPLIFLFSSAWPFITGYKAQKKVVSHKS